MSDYNSPPPGQLPGYTPNPTPAQVPPPIIPGPTPRPVPDASLGSRPEDRAPILGWAGIIDALLREPRRVHYQLRQANAGRLIAALVFIAAACALVYGLVVGTFSGGTQLWAAPLKVAAGLLISGAICLPSLYIFSCLSGSSGRLVEVGGLTAGLLALLTLLLGGFAPVAWVFSQSTQSVAAMGALHLAFWAVAAGFGLRFLRAGFLRTNARSTAGLNVWIVVFLLVSLQMTTALRPILGTADTLLPKSSEKQFFLSHWWQCLDASNHN